MSENPVITIATLIWDANKHSRDFSTHYTELDVEKLYRGFARNLTIPFEFVCFTDRERSFKEPIQIEHLSTDEPSYSNCIEPYRLGVPMILVGLDTVVTGNCDHLAQYCFTADRFALPRDPYNKSQACNGVALVPKHHERLASEHRGENDMVWVRKFPHHYTDDILPGQINSYKGHVEKHGLGDTRICYFHGQKKPHQLGHLPWIAERWV